MRFLSKKDIMTYISSIILVIFLLESCSKPNFDIVEMEKFDFTDVDTFTITYPDLEQDYLVDINNKYKLQDKISECKSDIQKAQIICHWVHELWIHHSSNTPSNSDPASILSEVMMGERYRCVEYSIVLSGCLSAIGLPARVIRLCSSETENCHVSSEVYLWDLQKWVMVDGNWDAIPVKKNTPLNCFELLIAIQNEVDKINISSLSSVDKWYFLDWMAPYLYRFEYNDNIESFWDKHAKDDVIILLPTDSERGVRQISLLFNLLIFMGYLSIFIFSKSKMLNYG